MSGPRITGSVHLDLRYPTRAKDQQALLDFANVPAGITVVLNVESRPADLRIIGHLRQRTDVNIHVSGRGSGVGDWVRGLRGETIHEFGWSA